MHSPRDMDLCVVRPSRARDCLLAKWKSLVSQKDMPVLRGWLFYHAVCWGLSFEAEMEDVKRRVQKLPLTRANVSPDNNNSNANGMNL